MRTIVVDVESYYDQDYSLRKMTPVEYILDHRWETIGWAVKDPGPCEGTPLGGAPAVWMTDAQFRGYLAGLPEKVAVVSHNALFDMCVLAWRYNYVPHLMIDTMGMARAWYGHKLRSVALASLATFLGVGVKGTTVHKVQGMGLAAIKAAGFYSEYAEYSKMDAEICWQIYRTIIREGFPVGEIAVMDTVLRCAVQPAFVLDQTLLAEHLHGVQAGKQALLDRLATVNPSGTPDSMRETLMSNDKFAEALRSLGVDPPTKISLVTGREAYAFAKTDAAFIELEEHENPEVQALVGARLGIKSTIEETRTQRLLSIANLTWPGNQRALMPMPLRYSGAHTHRLSGDWKLNMQNLPSRGNNKIRSALAAPDGHSVVAVDASQIEARKAGWFCGCTTLTSAFANKEDVYSTFASDVFGYEIHKSTHKIERFIGKTGVLGLQYGLGWPKFQATVAMQSKAQVGQEVILDDIDAMRVVQTYRRKYKEIPAMWRHLEGLIARMTDRNCYVELGPLVFMHEKIKLPSGLFLHYHNLENRDGQWWFTHGGKPKYLYGGKCLAADTKVLTDAGWLRIVDVTQKHKLWDGTQWVNHSGLMFQGEKRTAVLNGVRMTPDHEVLTEEGWRCASSCEGLHRAGFWLPDGSEVSGDKRPTVGLDFPVPVRGARGPGAGGRGEVRPPWGHVILRVYGWAKEHFPRNVGASSVRGLAVHGGSLPPAHPPSMEELRCSGDQGVSFLGRILRGFLGGYGGDVQAWFNAGQEGQQRGLHSAELPLGYPQGTGGEPQEHSPRGHSQGAHADGRFKIDPSVSVVEEPVYDIRNAGPNARFVVLGSSGPFIVHNCLENIVQALARICVMDTAVNVRRRIAREGAGTTLGTIRLNLQVHDELVYITPSQHAEWLRDVVIEEMCKPPSWGLDIPLDAEGGIGPSYGDCK